MRFASLALLGGLASCSGENAEFHEYSLGCETVGERACSGERPIRCTAVDGGGAPVYRNEACPSAARCEAGACLPPASAIPCKHEWDCAPISQSCAVFVNPAARTALATFCAAPEGQSGGAQSCKRNDECSSGQCVKASGATSGFCLNLCEVNGDCPWGSVCRPFDVTVTGIRGTLRSCAP